MHMCAPQACLVPLEEVIGSLRTGVEDDCEPPCGCWELTYSLCKNGNYSYLLSHDSNPLAGFLLLVCTRMLVEVRGQSSGVSSLLLVLDLRGWPHTVGLAQQALLPTDPHCTALEGFF